MKYDDEFKRQTVQKVVDGQSVRSISRELGVTESQIHKWRRAALDKGYGKQERCRTNRSCRFEETNSGTGNGERNFKKGSTYLRARKLKRCSFIDREKAHYPLIMLCRVMSVSLSGYYSWRKRVSKPPCLKRRNLAALISNCFFENRRRYGSRRITAALQKSGVEVGRAAVRRLMRDQNLKAIQPKNFKPKTTDSKGTLAAPNLLAQLKAEEYGTGKLIVGDITYVPLRNGRWCYLAVWQDKITRRIIGWSLQDSMTAELIISALQKAMRKGLIQAGAVVHSDRGSQYASTAFRASLRQNGFRQSMSGKGNCYDNAQAESFFSRFKAELIEGGVFENIEQARSEIFSYIEGYYNRIRLH